MLWSEKVTLSFIGWKKNKYWQKHLYSMHYRGSAWGVPCSLLPSKFCTLLPAPQVFFITTPQIYCHVPATQELQVTVAWGHRLRAPKRARITLLLKPPTYWVANCLTQSVVNYCTAYTLIKITHMHTCACFENTQTNGGSRQYNGSKLLRAHRRGGRFCSSTQGNTFSAYNN